MPGKILFLIDSLSVQPEALTYAVKLAARTDASLVVLVVLSVQEVADTPLDAERITQVERAVRAALTPHLDIARGMGVSLETVLRLGDPSSGLIKFLAESSTVQTIVWGGERSLASRSARRRKSHWLAQMRDRLGCPVVIPLPKSESDNRRQGG